MTAPKNGSRRTLAELSVPSEPGNERRAMEEVAGTVEGLGLPDRTLERLKTAVAEATMNAMEHGNRYREDVPVTIRVSLDGGRLWVRITDMGGEAPISSPVAPDLEAKLAGLQSPRGWGLFLIERMVDEMRAETDGDRHTLELGFDLEGGS